ncbi:MAG: type II secretion system protein [Candidatus Hydrogenedentes bacterium]|nr:type II secretion system protein [Candidatus Hydrogenedentota bacterium]
MQETKGFTLIELMIVITIMSIIAAIALPSLLRTRMTANEGSAIGSMRTISSAQQQFQSAAIMPFPSGMGQYAPDVATLAAQVPPFIDPVLGGGNKQGFNFTTVGGGVDGGPSFVANGVPLAPGASGNRAFFADESGLITYAAGAGPAGPGDNAVQ